MAVLLGPKDYLRHRSLVMPSLTSLARTVHQIFATSAALSMIPAKMAAKLKLPVWRRFLRAADTAMETGMSASQNDSMSAAVAYLFS